MSLVLPESGKVTLPVSGTIAENGDYTLRDDAPVFGEIPGFEPLPLSEMGRH